ncbi:MAG: hypothetical protein ACLGJC_09385 [Alphaproteobacteria bacterium]
MLSRTTAKRPRADIDTSGFLIPKGGRKVGRIDKSVLVFGEPERIRDMAYRKSAKDRICSVPGCGRPAACLAHIRTGMRGGTSLKPSDDEGDFLCDPHHQDQEKNPGPEWWFENVYVPQRKLAYRRWLEGKGR